MDQTHMLLNVVTEGGAYLPEEHKGQLSFGVEVEADYPLELLKDYEVICIPQSAYMVFNCPPYSIDNHGDVISSAWNTQKNYDIESCGYHWSYEKAPIYEEDNDETGYTLWFPISRIFFR